jgi:squalene cyclase
MINKLFYRFGSWGICFTYGTWFAIEGLSAVGQCYNNSTCIRKACQFLLSKQLRNGGWGESHLSSRTKVNRFGMVCYVDEQKVPTSYRNSRNLTMIFLIFL